MTQERGKHYSLQTGYFVRGQVARIRQGVERQVSDVPFMPAADVNMQQIIRRKMRRVTRDGR